jgi:hypothetical protein
VGAALEEMHTLLKETPAKYSKGEAVPVLNYAMKTYGGVDV